MEQLQDLLWLAVQAVLVAAIPLLIKLAFDWLKLKISELDKSYPSELETARDIVRLVVAAAEQLGATEAIDDKLDYAVEMAQSFLDAKGIKLDLEQLRALIEAEVNEQFGKDKPA